jgi:hypothetical protein
MYCDILISLWNRSGRGVIIVIVNGLVFEIFKELFKGHVVSLIVGRSPSWIFRKINRINGVLEAIQR